MYGWDTLVLLKHYLESGLSKTAIAILGVLTLGPVLGFVCGPYLDDGNFYR